MISYNLGYFGSPSAVKLQNVLMQWQTKTCGSGQEMFGLSCIPCCEREPMPYTKWMSGLKTR